MALCDCNGRRIPSRFKSLINPLGQRASTVFHNMARQQATMNPPGYLTTKVFNAMSQAIAAIDSLGNRTSYSSDPTGRTVALQNARGFVATSTCEAARRTDVQVDALGNRTTTQFDFDASGNQPIDQVTGGAATCVWNHENQVTAVITLDGSRVTMVNNANFR